MEKIFVPSSGDSRLNSAKSMIQSVELRTEIKETISRKRAVQLACCTAAGPYVGVRQYCDNGSKMKIQREIAGSSIYRESLSE